MRNQNAAEPTVLFEDSVAEPVVDPIELLVRRVRLDAREEPARYADETVVPEGGE